MNMRQLAVCLIFIAFIKKGYVTLKTHVKMCLCVCQIFNYRKGNSGCVRLDTFLSFLTLTFKLVM